VDPITRPVPAVTVRARHLDLALVSRHPPALATLPGSLLLCISSPYSRKGALWTAYRDHHGRDGDPILTWQAASTAMNPQLDEAVVARALEEDEAAARAEWFAAFRSDLESYISPEVVARLVVPGVHERGPSWMNRYYAFTDPAGGSGGDSMTLAVAHYDRAGDKAVLDLLREIRPPFNPETVVEEFAEVLERYRVRVVVGDRYGGDWPAAAFKRHHIVYKPAERTRSEIYRDVLPLLTSGAVELLDHPRLTRQLLALERRATMGGRDVIDHPAGHTTMWRTRWPARCCPPRTDGGADWDSRVSWAKSGSCPQTGASTFPQPETCGSDSSEPSRHQ
jgi:hypothetical protein